MSINPPRRVSGGLTGAINTSLPHRLNATSRAKIITRLDMIRKLPGNHLPERLFCLEILMYNFEINRSGKALRELLDSKYIEQTNFVSFEHIDQLKAKLNEMTPAKAKTINYPRLSEIIRAVRQEMGPVDPSAGSDEPLFTPIQFNQRVRSLSAMIDSLNGYQIAGQLVPLRILQKRRNGARSFDPAAALQDLRAELAQPTEKSDFIVLDVKYLELFRDQLKTVKEQYDKFGFDRLKTINLIVQEQYRAYQEIRQDNKKKK